KRSYFPLHSVQILAVLKDGLRRAIDFPLAEWQNLRLQREKPLEIGYGNKQRVHSHDGEGLVTFLVPAQGCAGWIGDEHSLHLNKRSYNRREKYHLVLQLHSLSRPLENILQVFLNRKEPDSYLPFTPDCYPIIAYIRDYFHTGCNVESW